MADDGNVEWSSNANEAVEISFVQQSTVKDEKPAILSTFHPHFTYPIFGDKEQIFGYKNLRIELRFAAHNVYPNVQVWYDEKFKTVGKTKATDIRKLLKDYLPDESTFDTPGDFDCIVQKEDASAFRVPGSKLHEYIHDDRQYEIWCGELTDPAVKTLLQRMQIFVSFYIEAGLPLSLDDQDWTLARWRVFFVYEKLPFPPTPTGSIYSLVGYSTSYRFLTYLPGSKPVEPFTFPPTSELAISSLPFRGRISQFLILPPHQKQSHGSHLYNTMVSTFLSDSACIEITVEDPNEAFDDLRDYCDYARLTSNGTFAKLNLNADLEPRFTARRKGVRVPTSKLLDQAAFLSLRKKNKIAPRQYNRLVELHLFSQIPKHSREAGTARLTQRGRATDPGDRAFYYWRLLVKQRLWKQHRDVLMLVESQEERVEKLEDTVDSQLGEYQRLMGRLEVGGGVESPGKRRASKRKVVESDSEDEGIDGEREGKRLREDEG